MDSIENLRAKKHIFKKINNRRYVSRGAVGREIRRGLKTNEGSETQTVGTMINATDKTVEAVRFTAGAVRTTSRVLNRKKSKSKHVKSSIRQSVTFRNTRNMMINSLESNDNTGSVGSGMNVAIRAVDATVDTAKTVNYTAKTTVRAVRYIKIRQKKRIEAKAIEKSILTNTAKESIVKAAATKSAKAAVALMTKPPVLIAIGIIVAMLILISIVSSIPTTVVSFMENTIMADENTAENYVQQVEELDLEFMQRIENYKNDSSYDEVVVNYLGDRATVTTSWLDIISIIAVERTQDLTYSKEEQKRINELFCMMNKMDTRVQTFSCGSEDCSKTHYRLYVNVYSYSMEKILNEIGFEDWEKDWAINLAASDVNMIFPGLELAPEGSDIVPSGKIFSWPVSGKVTSPFGYRIHPTLHYRKLHTGIDISAVSGTRVVAAESGKITKAGWSDSYGNYIKINHGSGVVTLYAHNTSLLVKVGQSVKRGQAIALSGSTGRSTGPHVHFEVRVNNVYQNPLNWL